MHDTFAFRFSRYGSVEARKIIFLVQSDFKTPQDAFYEGDVPHWENAETRTLTWGRMAGPMDLCLAPDEYDYYKSLVEACRHDFMSTVIDTKAEDLLKNQTTEDGT